MINDASEAKKPIKQQKIIFIGVFEVFAAFSGERRKCSAALNDILFGRKFFFVENEGQ